MALGHRVRTVAIGVGAMCLFVLGISAAVAAFLDDHPSPEQLILNSAPSELGSLTTSSVLDNATLTKLGGHGVSGLSGISGWVKDWLHGAVELRVFVIDANEPAYALEGLHVLQKQFATLGLGSFPVAGVAHADGEIGETAGGERSSVVVFARGSFLFSVGYAEPSTASTEHTVSTVERLAALEQSAAAKIYHAPSPASAKLDEVNAAGAVMGCALLCPLWFGFWGFTRDRLRRRRARGRPVPSLPVSPGYVVDVSSAARKYRRLALVTFLVQAFGASLIVDGVFPNPAATRVVLVVVGILLLALVWCVQLVSTHSRPFGGRARPVRSTLLAVTATLLLIIGGISASAYALDRQQTPGGPSFLASAACLFACAGILQRRARRISGLSVSNLTRRDRRPIVLYLRAFGDDSVALRTATLGRKSLAERFSPKRSDSFEEVLVRHLSSVGPVVAINPPGTTLAPIGAARETVPGDTWQATVDSWMAQARLVVIAAPPGTPSPGLVWELQRVTQRGHWGNTVVATPPVPDDEMRRRYVAMAGATAEAWPFQRPLPTDPARALVTTWRDDRWLAITADDRSEWTYAAALKAALATVVAPVQHGQVGRTFA